MGRPLNKRLFGANELGNLKVQFNNGTESVPGYIVKQKGSKRFICKDADGNVRSCRMVNKPSAELLPGQMTFTVAYDNGDVAHPTKIAAHQVTVNGYQQPWTFDPSTSDGKVQMEEAGTDDQLTGATDLEGDGFNGDYPVPGSGVYKTAEVALNGITYADIGTPYSVGGYIGEVPAPRMPGLYRQKYNGNFTAASNSAPSTWNYSFFDTATLIKSIDDEYVSWGQQDDGNGLGEHNFSVEWKGYFRVPVTQNYNFYAESDDHIAMWIGEDATNAPSNATKMLGANNKSLPEQAGLIGGAVNSNSVTLIADQWYPIRIWFSEHEGGCKAQIYYHGANDLKLNGYDMVFMHTTNGF